MHCANLHRSHKINECGIYSRYRVIASAIHSNRFVIYHNPPIADSQSDSVSSVVGVELAQYRADMILYRLLTYSELMGDMLICTTTSNTG